MDLRPVFAVLAAALGGAAVGIERQWSGHTVGPAARFGGIRTFTLLGGTAGMCGWLWTAGYTAPAVTLLAAAVAVIVVSYNTASRRDIDATTEMAALIVLAAGLLCSAGQIRMASAVIAVTCLLLLEKSRLHAWIARLNDDEVRAGVRFAVMAAVILPILPEGPIGPLGGIKPRELWLLVLFFSGLSYAGYIVRRAFGEGQGYAVAGALGGVISSTNVTITFARQSRSAPALARPLAVGVLSACAVLLVRVLVATLVLNPALSAALLPYVAAPFAVGLLFVIVGAKSTATLRGSSDGHKNPLQISQALQMAVLFQLVLFGVHFARSFWGHAGVLASGAVLGFTDVDALTVSMAKGAASGVPLAEAAQALAVGIFSNTLLKLAVSVFVGTAEFRRLAGIGLAIIAVAMIATLIALA